MGRSCRHTSEESTSGGNGHHAAASHLTNSCSKAAIPIHVWLAATMTVIPTEVVAAAEAARTGVTARTGPVDAAAEAMTEATTVVAAVVAAAGTLVVVHVAGLPVQTVQGRATGQPEMRHRQLHPSLRRLFPQRQIQSTSLVHLMMPHQRQAREAALSVRSVLPRPLQRLHQRLPHPSSFHSSSCCPNNSHSSSRCRCSHSSRCNNSNSTNSSNRCLLKCSSSSISNTSSSSSSKQHSTHRCRHSRSSAPASNLAVALSA